MYVTQVKQDVERITQKRVVKSIVSLGLNQSEAEVYVYLAKQGPQTARTIAETLKMQEHVIYRSLRSLKNKEILIVIPERPTEFAARPLDKALDFLINAHLKEMQDVEQEKTEILSQWRSMIIKQRKLT